MPLSVPKALQGLYFMCESIAEGSFGHLYLAIHALTRQKVAIKIIDKRKVGSEIFRVRGEIDALKRLSHPNIYSLYQVIETDATFFLILEYVPGGELFDYILQQGKLPEDDVRALFRQVVSAIGYSHAKGIAHRDLKPENILLKDEQTIRVIDYGLCAKNTDTTYLSTYCGSLAYAAPEVLANKEYNGFAADIWSLGVILYATLCGYLPFDPSKPEKLPKIISKGQYVIDENLSATVQDLLIRMLCVDPVSRIKMVDLSQHPWFMEDGDGPINFHADPKPPQPLNQDILKEMAAYTRLPHIEIARMIRKKSYDYLMATYVIMERMYMEDGVLLLLQRRGESNKSMVEAAARAAISNTPRDRRSIRPAPNNLIVNDGGFRLPAPPTHSNNSGDVNPMSLTTAQWNIGDIQHPKPRVVPRISAKPLPPKICEQSKPITLSPGRSVDSQLNELSKGLRVSEHQQFCPPSVHLQTPGNWSEEGSLYERLQANRMFDSSEMIASSNQSLNSMVSGTENGTTGNLNLYKQIVSRKSTSVGGDGGENSDFSNTAAPGHSVSGKLRKVRASNNVIRLRGDITAADALVRISESLRKNSIRFTLKRHGFTCTFSNDWGRTLLEFELEVVQVVGKFALPKLLQPKKLTGGSRGSNNHLEGSGAVGAPVADSEKTPPGSEASSKTSCGASTATEQQQTLGVKVKRLHGDSFTYASICRTVLDQAGVKADAYGPPR